MYAYNDNLPDVSLVSTKDCVFVCAGELSAVRKVWAGCSGGEYVKWHGTWRKVGATVCLDGGRRVVMLEEENISG